MEGDFYGRFLRGSLIGGDGGEGNGLEDIQFKERFPVNKSTRNIVANALYHTCCTFTLPYLPSHSNRIPLDVNICCWEIEVMVVLATKGVLKISQGEAYGDISLSMVI